MWLIGNANVENVSRTSVGLLGETRISFILPRRLRRRHAIKIRYFGYHSGAFLDIMQTNEYNANINGEKEDYGWRSACREVRMKVEVDGVNIMHDSVGVKRVKHMNGVQQDATQLTDYLTYPATLSTDAMNHAGGAVIQNTHQQPYAVHRAHHQAQDITLGFVDTSASKLEVVLTAEHISSITQTAALYSFEPNVRMDTISLVLELL